MATTAPQSINLGHSFLCIDAVKRAVHFFFKDMSRMTSMGNVAGQGGSGYKCQLAPVPTTTVNIDTSSLLSTFIRDILSDIANGPIIIEGRISAHKLDKPR
jgi:hypothetical protein